MSKVKLMKAKDWLAREFVQGSAPSMPQLKRLIELGEIRGRIVDSKAYVYEDQSFGVEQNISTAVDKLIRMSI